MNTKTLEVDGRQWTVAKGVSDTNKPTLTYTSTLNKYEIGWKSTCISEQAQDKIFNFPDESFIMAIRNHMSHIPPNHPALQ